MTIKEAERYMKKMHKSKPRTKPLSLERLVRRHYETILAALYVASLWEDSLAASYCKMKTHPQYRKSRAAAKRFLKVRAALVAA
jgi:hypothetical protein